MAMKRGYTALEYKSTIPQAARRAPGHPPGLDFIVGFPGETDEDHAKLMKLVE